MSNKESQLAVFLTSSEGMSCGRLYITLAALQCIDSRELNSFLFVPHRQIGSAYVTEGKMTLNRVVYLLWPSTFKGNVTRDSKNVCHGMFMVNLSCSLLVIQLTIFRLSIIVYAFTTEAGRRISYKIRWLQMVGAVFFACLKRYNFVRFNDSIDI